MALASGCDRSKGGTRTPTDGKGTPTTDTSATTPSLADLADRIDPGPTKGLLHGIPPEVSKDRGIDTGASDAELVLSLLKRWRAMPESAATHERIVQLIELGLVTAALDRGDPDRLKDPQAIAVLAQVYGTFDVPALFDPKGLFGSMIGVVAGVLARPPDQPSADAERTAAVLQWLSAALARLPALHRRMAARLMREAPDHPNLPDVIDRLAQVTSAKDPDLALALRRASMAKRGRFATSEHHREMAIACYVNLDLVCGDASYATAKSSAGGPADVAKVTTAVQPERDRAERILELAKSTNVDEQIERAKLLLELGRREDALAAYLAIRKSHPKDARAVVGVIDANLRETLDFKAAFETLDRAGRDLDHRDIRYLEASVGIRSMQVAYVVLPQAASGGLEGILATVLPVLVPIREDVAALAKLGNDKAIVLAFLLDLGDELLPAVRAGDNAAMMKVARGLLPRAVELRRKLPESRYAFDVVLAGAQFSTDGKAALAAVADPPKTDDAKLAMRAAMTRVAIAVTFGETRELAAVQEQIDAWPAAFGESTRSRALARVDMVSWRSTGDATARDRALARYETILAPGTQASDVDDLCNFAILLLDAGRKDDAKMVLDRALQLDGDAELVKVHRAALAEPVDLATLEALVASSEAQIGLAAVATLVASDKRPGARKKWIAKRKAMEKEPGLRGRTLPDANGTGVGSALNVGVGYSTTKGLELDLDAGPTPRIFVRPPTK